MFSKKLTTKTYKYQPDKKTQTMTQDTTQIYQEKTFIGIDIGTQSVKVIFYDAHTQEIKYSSRSELSLNQEANGSSEQLAEWWLDALANCMADIPSEIKTSAVAIGVSGQQHGFVPLDKNGKVLAPVKLWCDTSTTQECDELMEAMGGNNACADKLGNPIMPGYTASKILWLKKNRPEQYDKLHTILLPHDYLNFHLSGTLSMEYGDASGTGLLNIRTRQWDSEILNAIDTEKDLLKCLPPFGISSTLSPEIAALYGLNPNIPIACGGGDNMMAAIGTGNVDNDVVTVSLGSSGTVYAHSDQAIIDEHQRLAAFCSSTNGWLPLLCTMNCTLSTELIRHLFNRDIEQLEQAVKETPIGANGVLTLPFFNGERSPNLPKAKGTILGLDALNTTPENLLRSAMEGASFGLRLGIEALKDNGIKVKQIRLTGGGSKSASWRQMLADICDTVVVQVSPDEGAAFGAALQALHAYSNVSGNPKDIKTLCAEHVKINESSRHEPLKESVERYDTIYQEYTRAVDAISSFYQ